MTKEKKLANQYRLLIGQNGVKYVDPKSVGSDNLNISLGNSKLGPCLNIAFPIELSCTHACECYRKKKCYGCTGCFCFPRNQKLYSENYNFFNQHTKEEVKKAIKEKIIESGLLNFRWFEIGDVWSRKVLEIIVETAKENESVNFWFYTKKYRLINSFVDEFGLESIPKNLVIIFSHWMNEDGSYFPMDNRYNFPTSEFIPFGKEEEIIVNHICPCSDPNFKGKCISCDKSCRFLKHGESMGLLEHSTKETKARDKAIREARKTA